MKHISVSKALEYLGYILIGVGITLALTSCGDDDTLILSPDNVFRSSASSSISSTASSSSAALISSASSISSSDQLPQYIAPDFLVATSSRLFRGYLQDGIPRIELFAENRHVVNSGCRYSIDSSGIIYDHIGNTSWDSGIRGSVIHLGIYYYKYHNSVYVSTTTGDYRVPINGQAVKVADAHRDWYLANGYDQYAQTARAYNNSLFLASKCYMHDGTIKQPYEIASETFRPALFYIGNPHESSMMWRMSGKTTIVRCGDYQSSTTNTIKEDDLKTDQIKIAGTWYLGNGGKIDAHGYTLPTNAQRTYRKFALHEDGNYMWWYDSEADHVVRNSIHAPEKFDVVDAWQYNVTLPSDTSIDSKCYLRMSPMSMMRFDNGHWMYINKTGTLLCKNVMSGSMRVVMTNISGALAVNIRADRFHGERGY